MHRNDKSKYLLYIEPSKELKSNEPVLDEWTSLMEYALSKSISGTGRYSELTDMGDGFGWIYKGVIKRIPSFSSDSGYMGTHHTECGEGSSNQDYLLENGMITNSLSPFYLKYYRVCVSDNDMEKLKQLKDFYEDNFLNKTNEE